MLEQQSTKGQREDYFTWSVPLHQQNFTTSSLSARELSEKIHREGTDMAFVFGRMIHYLFSAKHTWMPTFTTNYQENDNTATTSEYDNTGWWQTISNAYHGLYHAFDETFVSGNTKLHRAILAEDEHSVFAMKGIIPMIHKQNVYGESALMLAVKIGRLDIVKYLIEHGAMLNQADDNGRMALYFAYQNHDNVMIAFLEKKGASIDNHQTSKQHLYIKFGYYNKVLIELKNGSLNNFANGQDETPIQGLINELALEADDEKALTLINTFKLLLIRKPEFFEGKISLLLSRINHLMYTPPENLNTDNLITLRSIIIEHLKHKHHLDSLDGYKLCGRKPQGQSYGGVYSKDHKKYLVKLDMTNRKGPLVEYITSGIMQKILGPHASVSTVILNEYGHLASKIEMVPNLYALENHKSKDESQSHHCKHKKIYNRIKTILATILVDDQDNHFGNLSVVESTQHCHFTRVDYDRAFAQCWWAPKKHDNEINKESIDGLNRLSEVLEQISSYFSEPIEQSEFLKSLDDILNIDKDMLKQMIIKRLDEMEPIFKDLDIPLSMHYDDQALKRQSGQGYQQRDFIETKARMLRLLDERFEQFAKFKVFCEQVAHTKQKPSIFL